MSDTIKKYLSLRTALLTEKSKLETRLREVSKALGQAASVVASSPVATGGRRKSSEATKAKMRAAQQARWAKIKGKTQPSAVPAKKKRKMSAAGRARIAAAAKARWVKAKAKPARRKTLGD